MLIYGWKDSRAYTDLAWFIYRYFSQNPDEIKTQRHKWFYFVLDAHFMKKYCLETEEKTRGMIKSLFGYESENPIIINETVIEDAIINYESTPHLLD